MDTRRLIEQLSLPSAYPHPVDAVETRQTHISVVFLAGPFAYKIKKPVALGFLDFSTLERRRHFCEEEVRLNRRLAPHVYLGVEPIVEEHGRLLIGGSGDPVAWAVKMMRLSEGASLLGRVIRNEVGPADMTRLARFLADFHLNAETSPRIASFGRFDVVAGNARENFAQSEPHIGTTLSRGVFDRLRRRTDAELDRLRSLIELRCRRGVPRDTHGDLHLDHVFLNDGDVFAIDCIEFNERFRYADPVADIAFLVMDLIRHRRPDLAQVLTDEYFRVAADEEGQQLLPFYTAYRAAVRAKVAGFKASDPAVPAADRAAAIERAKASWLLALAELEEPSRRPALVLVGGLPGTGKSTLARELAAAAGFEVIRSDLVRKELAGLRPEDRGGDELYTPEWTERPYAECLARAAAALFDGKRVIVDATFREDRFRQRFFELARRLGVPALFLICEASSEVVRERLAARTGDVSDATWEVYQRHRGQWDEPGSETLANATRIETNPGANPAETARQSLRERGLLEVGDGQ
jgi:aminoglycoside phosphotransferase family enzyme/predicted kinase